MSMAGLSKSRLERMDQMLSGYVERNEMPGLVALVSRHDDLHVETIGTMAVGDPAPMKRDTIFRIASITKPITAVAAMILVEDRRAAALPRSSIRIHLSFERFERSNMRLRTVQV